MTNYFALVFVLRLQPEFKTRGTFSRTSYTDIHCYPYVHQQVQAFARSMKRIKVNSKISEYATIQELTPEILKDTIERIEIGHVTRKSKPGNVIRIYWKLQ